MLRASARAGTTAHGRGRYSADCTETSLFIDFVLSAFATQFGHCMCHIRGPKVPSQSPRADASSSLDTGGFRVAQYGPMYSLKPRKNELMIRVKI